MLKYILYEFEICRCGGIGRHKGLKIPRSKIRTGSSPVSGISFFSIPGQYCDIVRSFFIENIVL